jgi:hypothetical protein
MRFQPWLQFRPGFVAMCPFSRCLSLRGGSWEFTFIGTALVGLKSRRLLEAGANQAGRSGLSGLARVLGNSGVEPTEVGSCTPARFNVRFKS